MFGQKIIGNTKLFVETAEASTLFSNFVIDAVDKSLVNILSLFAAWLINFFFVSAVSLRVSENVKVQSNGFLLCSLMLPWDSRLKILAFREHQNLICCGWQALLPLISVLMCGANENLIGRSLCRHGQTIWTKRHKPLDQRQSSSHELLFHKLRLWTKFKL